MNRSLTQIAQEMGQELRCCGEIMKNADRDAFTIDAKEGHANLVTSYDQQIQRRLNRTLLEIVPEAVFVGEEEEVHAAIEKGWSFIVDPIDGTTNFIKDLHWSAVSAALLKDGQPVVGVIYNPYLDELYTAVRGQGAFCSGRRIHVSDAPLSAGVVLFGTSPYHSQLHEKTFELARSCMPYCIDVRRYGAASLDLCMVACGRAELYFELILSPWDYAAGALIVEEAGGVITQMDGTPITYDQPCSVLVRAPQIRAEWLAGTV